MHVKMRKHDEIRCMSKALVLVHSMLGLAFERAIKHGNKLLSHMDMSCY